LNEIEQAFQKKKSRVGGFKSLFALLRSK
jgi:hypothetical protein